MIEVLFGESEAGAMKFAKSNKEIRKACEGVTSVWGDESLLQLHKEWKSVPGTAEEVVCLPFLLDIGDLKEKVDSQYRMDLILSMYTQSGWENSEQYINELKDGIKEYVKEYDRLQKFLEEGQAIRIWYSHAAYSLCGFYWLCNQLCEDKNKVYVVELPEYRENTENNTIISYRNWSEIQAEEFSSFLELQREVSKNEQQMFAQKWAELVADNSPLRAVINNELVGVPENFYDFLIGKRLTSEPIIEARLIGEILGNYPVGVRDWWYAYRIEQMIKDGRIKVLQDSEQKYTRTICLK